MAQETITLTVGQSIGTAPPKEGYMPVINGSSFDIIAFFSDITDAEINDWLRGEVRYGIYIEKSIPIFILDLGKSWNLDLYLNIHHESENVRRGFFEGDPNNTKMRLTLVSFSDSIVRGIRIIAIDPNIMMQIKEACFRQLSRYSSKEDCQIAAEGLLERFSSKDFRAMLK